MEVSLRPLMEIGKKEVSIQIPAGARQHNAGDLGLQIGKNLSNFVYLIPFFQRWNIFFSACKLTVAFDRKQDFMWLRDYREEVRKQGGVKSDHTRFVYQSFPNHY